jgi:hypothetical protein
LLPVLQEGAAAVLMASLGYGSWTLQACKYLQAVRARCVRLQLLLLGWQLRLQHAHALLLLPPGCPACPAQPWCWCAWHEALLGGKRAGPHQAAGLFPQHAPVLTCLLLSCASLCWPQVYLQLHDQPANLLRSLCWGLHVVLGLRQLPSAHSLRTGQLALAAVQGVLLLKAAAVTCRPMPGAGPAANPFAVAHQHGSEAAQGRQHSRHVCLGKCSIMRHA